MQVFSCYRGWKEARQATSAISTTWRREVSSSFFFLQGKALKEIDAILAETLGEHAPSYATVKNWLAQFKCGEFSACDAPGPGWHKKVITPEIIDQIHELILEVRWISVKHAEALREVGPEMPERGSKTSTMPVVWATFGIFSARSKLFPVAIGDHRRNLIISLWPGDKATINGVAA